MSNGDRALTMLIHGAPKVGKSTLSISAPYPRLYLDVEMASRFLPIQRTVWDPLQGPPPIADGSWDTCAVITRDWATVERVYQWLQTGPHQFKSLIIDSISELQVRCQESISGRGTMQTQQWGDLLRRMSGLMRDLRDLTTHPRYPLDAVVLTAMTRQIDGVYKPHLQGQLATIAPYFYDLVGYLFVETVQSADPTQPPTQHRRLLTAKDNQFEAGERVGGRLPSVVENPNIAAMIETVFGGEAVAEATQ